MKLESCLEPCGHPVSHKKWLGHCFIRQRRMLEMNIYVLMEIECQWKFKADVRWRYVFKVSAGICTYDDLDEKYFTKTAKRMFFQFFICKIISRDHNHFHPSSVAQWWLRILSKKRGQAGLSPAAGNLNWDLSAFSSVSQANIWMMSQLSPWSLFYPFPQKIACWVSYGQVLSHVRSRTNLLT